MTVHPKIISGAGFLGGKGGNKGDKNSLRSNATVRLIDLIGEGEIGGLVNGGRSIFFDETPLQNEDGTFNFEGVEWEARDGLPIQPYIPGFAAVENEVAVGVKVEKALPITRLINEDDVDALRVTVRLPSLTKRDEDNGALLRTSVQYRLEVCYDGGPWVNATGDVTISGKCTAPYDRSHLIPLPRNPGGTSAPWTLRMTRITDDSEDLELQNDTYLASYTRITYGKFTYPNSAYVALTASADQFGQNMPERMYEVYGRIMRVPANYDPMTRTYATTGVGTSMGEWNGTFKWAWTDNPAWVFYDLLSDERFGLGEDIDVSMIDKWGLYEIAKYCDGMVPDGMGGEGPRFTFNQWIRTQQEAYDALNGIATAFRGMSFWSSGSVMATQDRPGPVTILADPSNVIDGSFSYQGSALKARHTVCVVRWYNPADAYNPDYVVIEDQDAIALYGYRETEVDAQWCTDRAQAYRIGEWTLFTELNETQVIAFSGGMDFAGTRPGDIIAVQDPAITEADLGGRLKAGSTATVLQLDHPITFEAGNTYSVYVTLPDGKVEERPVVVSSYDTEVETITVSVPFSIVPEAETLWILATDSLKPSLWRVIGIREGEPNIYEVTAAQHEPGKFEHIDQSAPFIPQPTRPIYAVEPPSNLQAQDVLYTRNGVPKTDILLSWTAPSPLSAAAAYEITADTPDGQRSYGRITSTSITITDAPAGQYKFYVSTINFSNRVSLPAEIEYVSEGWEATPVGVVQNLRIKDQLSAVVQFTGRTCEFVWENVFTGSTLPNGNTPVFLDNEVKVYDTATNSLLRTEFVRSPAYSYTIDKNIADNAAAGRPPSRAFRIEVKIRDTLRRSSDAATKSVSNPTPPAPSISMTPAFNGFQLSWNQVGDADYAGNLVWISTLSGFNPLTTQPVFDGRQNTLYWPTEDGVTYYVRVAAYDEFGKTGLNISSEIVAYGYGDIDTTPPGVPTGLALSSSIDPAVPGTVQLVATWNANTESDLTQYELQVREGTGNWISFPGSATRWERSGLKPATSYSARVRAFDRSNNISAYSTIVSHTTAVDNVPPAVPSGLAALGGFEFITLNWSRNTEADFSHYEVYMASASTPAPVSGTAASFTTTTNSKMVDGLTGEVTRHFWVRAVDTSGNKSAWSARVQATTVHIDTEITTEMLVGLIDQTSLAIGNVLIETFTGSLPTTGNFEGRQGFFAGKLYRYTSGAWTASVASTDITGQLIAGQIADGAINVAKFASGIRPVETLSALPATGNFAGRMVFLTTDNKLYRHTGTPTNASGFTASVPSTDITGQLTDAQIASIGAAKLTGTITTTQIGNDQITTPKIAAGQVVTAHMVAGSILADRLVAGSITATQIAAGTITATQINAASISAAILTANSIAAGMIQAGAISAAQIAAGAIRAEHLYVGQTSTNLVMNPTAASGAGTWRYVEGNMAVAPVMGTDGPARTGSTTFKITGTAANNSVAMGTRAFPVQPGKKYAIRFARKADVASATGTYCRVQYRTAEPPTGYIGVTTTANYDGRNGLTDLMGGNGPITTDWVENRYEWTCPANTYWASLAFYRWTGMGANNSLYVDDVLFAEQTLGVMIEDGAVTANKILAGEIQTVHMAAGSINADRLMANSITAGQIAAGAIGADQIAANAIIASKIAVGDYSNMVRDDKLSDPAAWNYQSSPGSSVSIQPASVAPGSGAGTITAERIFEFTDSFSGGTNNVQRTNVYAGVADPTLRLPVEAGSPLWFSYKWRSHSAAVGNICMFVAWFDAAGVQIGAEDSVGGYQNMPNTNVTRVQQQLTPPATAATVYFRIRRGASPAGASSERIWVFEPQVRRAMSGELIVDGAITASKLSTGEVITLSAQIKDAIITNAHVLNLDAGKITTGFLDAARIQANSINASKINITGATTLANWQQGGDTTKIAGGAISANTIDANKLSIGLRNVKVENITFEHNAPSANRVSWTAGVIRYVNDAGSLVSASIAAMPAGPAWTSGVLYIYWAQGATTLSYTTTATTAFGANNVVLATYQGGVNLTTDIGRTIIDGSTIKTGTITASQIAANAITAVQLAANAIQAQHIQAGAITASKLTLSDRSNLFPDQNFEDDAAWLAQSFSTLTNTGFAGISKSRFLSTDRSAGSGYANNQYLGQYVTGLVPVAVGETFYWSYKARAASSGFVGRIDLLFQCYAADGTTLTANLLLGTHTSSSTSVSVYEGNTVIPANTAFVKFGWRLGASTAGTFSGAAYIWDHVVRRAASAELIVDGSITATKIGANQINATHINVSTLSAISSNVGTMTAGVLQSADGKFVIDLNNRTITMSD